MRPANARLVSCNHSNTMHLDEVMWPNKYTLMTLGLWPSTHTDPKLVHQLFINFRIATGTFAAICMLVPHFMTVVANWGNINILGEYGVLTVFFSLVTLKILYCAWNRRKLGTVYQRIKDFWDISDDSEERKQYEQLANFAKLVTIVCFISGIMNTLSFEVTALNNWIKNRHEINESLQHRPLPMELYYGFDTQITPTYEILYVWQSVCMFYSICVISGCDCTMMVFIIHISGQFKLISYQFRKLGRKISKKTISKHKLNIEIGKYIAHHQQTIQATEELNSLQSPLFFCQIVTSGLQICLSGYAVIEGENSGAALIKFFVLFISLLCQLVIWCAPAELLIHESTAIAKTIYCNVPWFELTPSQRTDLGFIVMRAHKECHVTASYQVMSIRKLTDVFNAAGSYIYMDRTALLRSMKK